ncbi:MAG: DUF2461 domain-containing protein [Bacteroidia bacterium]|nr:DUF2461 domain-containing protein [Bacteroidia bacterium]
MSQITSATFDFLNDLEENNNREWFTKHKDRYESSHKEMVAFAEDLYDLMIEEDNLVPMSGKKVLFRIYRDVRFAKDKSPYKSHWSGRFKRATALLRGGFYFHIKPGNSYAAGGFFGPNSEDMRRIREDIAADDKPYRRIFAKSQFQDIFGRLTGDKVKTAPKGYSKDHPAIDLLRHKQFLLHRDFSDEEVLAPDFAEKIRDTFLAMHPFLDHMSEVLTTDGNGNRIV